MQQRFRRLALVVSAASLAGGGLIMVACGTDNGEPVATPQIEAGKAEASTGRETGPDPLDEAGVPDGGDSGVDCSKAPILRDFANSFRCAFKDAGGAEAGSNCTNGETCCNTSDKVGNDFQPSYCATGKGPTGPDGEQVCKTQAIPNGSSFNVGKAWECADKNACGAGEVCCVIQDAARLAADPNNKLNMGNTPAADKNYPAACGVQRVYNEGGSRCRAACAAGEIKLCSLSDDNCGAGTKCTPFIDFQNTHRGFCK